MNNKAGRKLGSGLELISWVPAIITIIIIWALSLETGTVSTGTSAKVTSDIAVRSFFGISLSWFTKDAETLEILHSIVRSMAHVCEYGLLALCIGLACTVNKVRGRFRLIYMFIMCGIISLSDEMLQVFVPDRYGDLKDIVCDMSGVLISILFVMLLGKLRKAKGCTDKSKIHLFNITIDNITFDSAIKRIEELASEKNGRHYILTPNVDHMVKLERDSLFAEIYRNADMVVTDGTPLMWMMDSIGFPICEKITGADMLPKVSEMAAKSKKSIFILGAGNNVAKAAEINLKHRYKGLKVVGTYSPGKGFENNEDEIKKVIDRVNAAKPDILVLALGSPKQEKFIYKYRNDMNFGVALPFGAAVDFAADNVRRAPVAMRKMGLEWLYRFLQEPGRLFRRYFVDDFRIFVLFWKYRVQMLDQNSHSIDTSKEHIVDSGNEDL